jgi:hypothetical protein
MLANACVAQVRFSSRQINGTAEVLDSILSSSMQRPAPRDTGGTEKILSTSLVLDLESAWNPARPTLGTFFPPGSRTNQLVLPARDNAILRTIARLSFEQFFLEEAILG